MKVVIAILALGMVILSPNKIDFGTKDGQTSWRVVNDGVMGGLSIGKVEHTESSMVFTGDVSLANNGGFASIRSSYAERDLAEYTRVKLRYRSDGYNFGLTMNKDRRFWIPNYKQPLEPTNWKWKVIEFDLLDFKEYYIGRATGRKISESELKRIIQIGFITNEKREGPFKIEIDYLEFI